MKTSINTMLLLCEKERVIIEKFSNRTDLLFRSYLIYLFCSFVFMFALLSSCKKDNNTKPENAHDIYHSKVIMGKKINHR